MPGKFISCPLCGQAFGSASISIHVPQCYDKALRRWEQQDPRNRGPKPMLPMRTPQAAPPNDLKKFGGLVDKTQVSQMPSRSVLSQQQQKFDPYAAMPMQLSKCRKCGRGFAYDRIQYHESVCIGNKTRKQFNSKKQRLSDFDQFELRAAAAGGGGAGGGGGRKGAPSMGSRGAMAAPPKTSWRQQHNDFIAAMRSAKRYTMETKARQGPPSVQARGGGGGAQRQPYATSALRNPNMYRNPPQALQARGPAPQTSRDVLPRVGRGNGPPPSFQFDAPQRQQLVARSAQQPQRGGGNYGGGGGGYGGGGGGGFGGGGAAGKVSILNSNVTSDGMLQAFGRR